MKKMTLEEIQEEAKLLKEQGEQEVDLKINFNELAVIVESLRIRNLSLANKAPAKNETRRLLQQNEYDEVEEAFIKLSEIYWKIMTK